MIKKHLKLLIITSIITILPIFAGVILWDKLPAQVPCHMNFKGEIDGYCSKAFAVFVLPAILLGAHWLCALGTSADPKKTNHSVKILHLILWIIPLLSIITNAMVYLTALGIETKIETILPVLVGLILAIVGNYLPKCKQSYTIGIKLPWTLSSEENWNRTHRLAGRIWLICSVAIIISGFIKCPEILLGAFLIMIIVPTIYSYLLYKKGI